MALYIRSYRKYLGVYVFLRFDWINHCYSALTFLFSHFSDALIQSLFLLQPGTLMWYIWHTWILLSKAFPLKAELKAIFLNCKNFLVYSFSQIIFRKLIFFIIYIIICSKIQLNMKVQNISWQNMLDSFVVITHVCFAFSSDV